MLNSVSEMMDKAKHILTLLQSKASKLRQKKQSFENKRLMVHQNKKLTASLVSDTTRETENQIKNAGESTSETITTIRRVKLSEIISNSILIQTTP